MPEREIEIGGKVKLESLRVLSDEGEREIAILKWVSLAFEALSCVFVGVGS